MSYDLTLANPVTKEVLWADAPHDMRGGTYVLGGTKMLYLNITYNYHDRFAKAFDSPAGIYTIYGMSGAESIPIIQAAIARLGNETSDDYWTSTDGNAKQALYQLLAMAQMRPDGVWNPEEAEDNYVKERQAQTWDA